MEEYFSKNLDHLEIVAAVCDEIGIVDTVDRLIPRSKSGNLNR